VRTYEDHIMHMKEKWMNSGRKVVSSEMPQLVEEIVYTIEVPEDYDEPHIILASGKRAMTDTQLLEFFATGDTDDEHMILNNCKIDTVFVCGLNIDRYRRECLKCGKTIVAYGKHNRCCDICRNIKCNSYTPIY